MTIENKIQAYHDIYTELKPLIDEMKTLEKEIKSHVLETGQIPEVAGVEIKLRKGYKRSTWNNDMLRGYATSHPEILDFAKETLVKASVSMRVK
jgi:hypothetical protein